MIDIHTESLIPVNEIPSHVPGRIHLATGWRWIQRGCRGVKLETVLVGGRRYCSREAIHRFIEATTAAADGDDHSAMPSNQRQRDIDRARRECKLAGI